TMQWMSVFTGILIILMAWSNQVENWPILGNWTNFMRSIIQQIFAKTKELPIAFRSFSFGIANGVLPCGLVYLGLTNALGGTTIVQSTLAMSAFGLGTIPAMFFMPLIAKSNWKIRLPKVVIACALSLIGLFTIMRGMNLGIPFISPQIKMEIIDQHGKPSLQCCEDTCLTK
ncbi:MAG: hypothetical protein RJB36_808, partial [Bacteroidota bacterium]